MGGRWPVESEVDAPTIEGFCARPGCILRWVSAFAALLVATAGHPSAPADSFAATRRELPLILFPAYSAFTPASTPASAYSLCTNVSPVALPPP